MKSEQKLNKATCSNCGAQLIFDIVTQATVCNFCGGQFSIGKAEGGQSIWADKIVPFKVDKKSFHQAVLAWLSEGDYTPDDILLSSVFDQPNGLFLPMYFFSGAYDGTWSASSGYRRKEEYQHWNDHQKKFETKTREVTDWRPSNGQIKGTFEVLCFGGAGPGIKAEVVNYAENADFETSDFKEFDSQYTLGFGLLEYTSKKDDVWRADGNSQAERRAESSVKPPGDTYKDLNCTVRCDLNETLRVYTPFWIVYYTYRDKKYYVIMDGAHSSTIEGKRPEDKNKIDQVKKFFFVPKITLFAWLAVWSALAYFTEYGTYAFGLGASLSLGLFISAFMRKNNLIKKSKMKRQEILKGLQIPASESEDQSAEDDDDE